MATPDPDPAPAPAAPDVDVVRALALGRRRTRLGRIARWAAAVALVLVATGLGLVPGVPGYPLFVIALLLVAADFPPARRLAVRIQRKLPIVRRALPQKLRKLARRERE